MSRVIRLIVMPDKIAVKAKKTGKKPRRHAKKT